MLAKSRKHGDKKIDCLSTTNLLTLIIEYHEKHDAKLRLLRISESVIGSIFAKIYVLMIFINSGYILCTGNPITL